MKHLITRTLLLVTLVLLAGMALAAADAALTVLEPASTSLVPARTPERGRWTWNQPMAAITPSGDLQWQPLPFHFVRGASARYIDFAQGNDGGDGSQAHPWKHHPWDPAATGNAKGCTGVQTYVFKGGVTYRGQLIAQESGNAGDPIRLTRDPAWGVGEAVISGAEAVTGWTQGADNKDIPDAGKVWWVDVPFLARNVWQTEAGHIQRIPLACIPHWKVADPNDPMSEWWSLEQPEWWTGKWKIDFNGHRAHEGIDTKHLTQPAAYYIGAVMRPEFAVVMGTPFPTRVEGFDAEKKGLIFQGIWFGDSEQEWTGNRYYLEDKPQFLDADGMFWAEPRGTGCRIYLRLPGDRDPNTTTLEVGRQCNLIESHGMCDVAITGLTFRYSNTYWDLTQPSWGNADVDNAAIRVRGACVGLTVAHCRFDHLSGKALLVDAKNANRFDRLAFDDNDVDTLDHGAINIECGGRGDVEVLRNRMREIGSRPQRQDSGHALQISFPQFMHVAGNMLSRCYGAGIFVSGGKASGDKSEVSLSRSLIHDNRVVDSLLAANDWGGIETWQCGPHYLYNNISGNAVGYWNCTHRPDAKGSACLGYNYYFDGSFRNAVFNNVAWGGTQDRESKFFGQSAMNQAVPTIENSFFNNTFADFAHATNWSPAGGRQLMLGNLLLDIQGPVIQWGQLKEDKGPAPAGYPHDSTALSHNVFAGCGAPDKPFGVFEATGTGYPTLEAMQAALATHKPLAADIGTATEQPVVVNDATHDYHPLPGSAAIGAGVKAFVPWTIGRTVGEWYFRRNNSDPTTILDDHWYPTSYFTSRDSYYQTPVWNLTAVGVAAKDYVAGPLEDWTDGALQLDGQGQYASITNDALTMPKQFGSEKPFDARGGALTNPDIATDNLLIEAYLRPAAGQGAAVIVGKMAENGYQLALNRAGGVTLTLAGAGRTCAVASGAKIADGHWHHLLAEVDRASGVATIYTDGVKTSTANMKALTDVSLSNTADLIVGKGFAGAIEYLRIARSTLADSRTTIEELYDWEFDGPFLRDFAGRDVKGKRRDAGAFLAR